MTRKTLVTTGLLTLSALAAAPAAQAAFPGRNGSIAFQRMVANKQADLFLMRPDGGKVRRLTATRSWEEKPEWSADGRRLVFSLSTPAGDVSEIATLRLRGRAVRALTSFGSISAAPTFAPDGRVAFFSLKDFPAPGANDPPPPAELYTIAADGGAVRRITDDQVVQTDPEWSPDGAEIMYANWRAIPSEGEGVFDIGLSALHPDGTQGRAIVTPSPRDVITQDWSPDGRHILLELATSHPHGRDGRDARQSDLAVIDANGGHFHWLTRTAALESMAVWSPDGKRIAFASDRHVKTKKPLDRGGPAYEIYTMSAGGKHLKRITHNRVPDLYPTWEPAVASR